MNCAGQIPLSTKQAVRKAKAGARLYLPHPVGTIKPFAGRRHPRVAARTAASIRYVRISSINGFFVLASIVFVCAPSVRCEPVDPTTSPRPESEQRIVPGSDGQQAAAKPRTSAHAETERIDRLIRQLGSNRFDERERATQELMAAGAPALPALRQALHHPDPEVVRRVKECIPAVERTAKISTLIADLRAKSPQVRARAADGLWEIGRGAKAAVPALVQTLDDADLYVLGRAAVALRRMGPDAKPAVPKLLELLRNKSLDEDFRFLICVTLGFIGPDAGDAIPELLHMLTTEVSMLRRGAAYALGDIGQGEKAVISALLKALKDPDKNLQSSAAWALGRIGKEPATVVPAIVGALKQYKRYKGDNDPRVGMLGGLASYGPAATSAMACVLEIARDQDGTTSTRYLAVYTLQMMGLGAKPALLTLAKELPDTDTVSAMASRALQDLERETRPSGGRDR